MRNGNGPWDSRTIIDDVIADIHRGEPARHCMADLTMNFAQVSKTFPTNPLTRRQQLTRIAIVVVAVQLALVFVAIGSYKHFLPFPPGLSNHQGVHYGHDYLVYYAAARLALDGRPADAYDLRYLDAEVKSISGRDTIWAPWVYPPTFFLFVLPFGLLPYIAAYATWCTANLGAGLIAGLTVVRRWWLPIAACLFPGAWMNLFAGQNGGLSAALMLGGIGLLQRSPIASGVLFGLMSFKPQFGILIPLALAADRQWICFASAAASVIGLAAVSYLAFGAAPWNMFISHFEADWRSVAESDTMWLRSVTVYPMARLAGLGQTVAGLVQLASAAIAAGIVFWTWRRLASFDVKASALAFGTLLTIPRGLIYDLAILLVPFLFLLVRAVRRSALQDWIFLALIWIAPVAGYILFETVGFLIWPVLLWMAMLYCMARYSTPVIDSARHQKSPHGRNASSNSWG